MTNRQWPYSNADAIKDYANPKYVKILDGSAITVAYVPAGTDIPKPSTIGNLANPNAGEGGGTTPAS
jgi:hypothetical protein